MGRARAAAALALALALSLGGAARAAEPTGTAAPDPEQRVAAIRESRQQVQRDLLAGDVAGVDRELLERLERVYDQQVDELGALAAATHEAAPSSAPQAPAAAFSAAPPYPFALLDAVHESLSQQAARQAQLEDALARAREAVAAGAEEQAAAERARRGAREALEGAEDAARPERAAELHTRELESRLAAESQTLHELRRDTLTARLRVQRAAAERLREVEAWVESHLAADHAELAAVREELESQEFDLKRRVEAARVDLAAAERSYAAAQRRADAAGEADPVAAAELAARRAELGARQRSLSLLEDREARLDAMRKTWERRFQLHRGGVDSATLADWARQAEDARAAAEREERIKTARLADLGDQLAALRARPEPAGDAARWQRAEARSLEDVIELYREDLAHLRHSLQLEARLDDELAARLDHVPLSERLAALGRTLGSLWSFEIGAVEDHSVTVGKVVVAIVVFGLGLLMARLLARFTATRLLARVRLDEGATAAFESLVFYALVVIVFITALRTVNIPLTAFTLLGGALAIGVGFGSQNVVSNFIGGLILLAERPVKKGDLVEVDDVYGTVEHIGLRSTRIRTGSNIHMILPNTALLENRVINWTHNDPNVRISISVGVIYGSPTREVERLLLEALAQSPEVQERPRPLVLFRDFGNDALQFEAHFWIRMRNLMDRWRIESDLRFRIDDRFREAGVVIAFPQRDVHLDASSPLELRLVDGREPGSPRPE